MLLTSIMGDISTSVTASYHHRQKFMDIEYNHCGVYGGNAGMGRYFLKPGDKRVLVAGVCIAVLLAGIRMGGAFLYVATMLC